MSWKIRHEGSPRSVEGLSLQAVVDGLQDGLWEPTDEVMGPDDPQWTAIENHPQLADIAMDIEPPPPKVYDDETRLDMNPLIDVALVLLIFFILTTSYAALQKMLDMPKMSADKPGVPVYKQEDVEKVTIRVDIRLENGKPVIRVEGQPTDSEALVPTLQKLVSTTHKKQLLVDHEPGVEWAKVVEVIDAAKGADIPNVIFLDKGRR